MLLTPLSYTRHLSLAATVAFGFGLLVHPPAVAQPCPASVAPHRINPSGAIAGTCGTSAEPFSHGFVRNGETITTFVVQDGPVTRVTRVGGINPAGTITGGYIVSFALHGYLRAADGTITTFRVPGSLDTEPLAINPSGVVAGYFDEAISPFSSSGFIRNVDGTLVTFQLPGSTGFTIPTDINPDGVVTGRYTEAAQVGPFRGFIRAADGTFTTFLLGFDTRPVGINPAGIVVGSYADATGGHGFLRNPDGSLEAVDIIGSKAVEVAAINPAGIVTGTYENDSGTHSFVRQADGRITTFDVPGAVSTTAESISPAGDVTGSTSKDGCVSGFIRDRSGAITIFNLLSASADEVADGSLGRASARHAAASLPDAREMRLGVPARVGGSWRIEYSLPTDADVTLALYDVAGRRLATLDRGFRNAGTRQVMWAPNGVARGIYFLRIQAGGSRATRAIAVRD